MERKQKWLYRPCFGLKETAEGETMIYTITLNPSLDVMLWTKDFHLGMVNRVEKQEVFPGGKGLNVSILLSRLGIENQALGFIAGFTGEEILESLKQQQCSTDFIRLINGRNRINVKLIPSHQKDFENQIQIQQQKNCSESRQRVNFQETDFNGPGPEVSKEAMEELYQKLEQLSSGDWIVLAGSIPEQVPQDAYCKLLDKVSGKGVFTIVDTTGNALRQALPYRPFLIKPNQQELGELFGTILEEEKEIIEAGQKLQADGAQNVLISMGERGAILISENQVIKMTPPAGKVVQTVGAGDSMVAGFLTGYLKTGELKRALELGVAAGSASAYCNWLAEREQILALVSNPEIYGF